MTLRSESISGSLEAEILLKSPCEVTYQKSMLIGNMGVLTPSMTILQKLQKKVKNKKNEIIYTPFKTIHTPIVMLVIDSDSIDFTVYCTGCPYLATGIRIGDVSQTEAEYLQ